MKKHLQDLRWSKLQHVNYFLQHYRIKCKTKIYKDKAKKKII